MMSMECTPQSTSGRNLAVTTGDDSVYPVTAYEID